MKVVNLSRRRFVNVRPVTRTTVVLWLVGVALAATNLYLFLQYWIDSVEVRSQREQTLDLIDQERDAIRDINRRFDSLDLSVQNQRVEFLNTLIRARTFPWSQLFGDLEEVLISDARVTTVQPHIQEEEAPPPRRRPSAAQRTRSRRERSRSSARNESQEAAPKPPAEPESQKVRLSLRGYVKDDQALADLVDAFYADPSFEEPYLAGESTDQASGGLSFNLSVVYLLPWKPPATARFPEETVTAGSPAAGSPAAGSPAASAGEAQSPPEPDTGSPAAETPATAKRAGAESSEEATTESLWRELVDEAAAAPPRTRPPVSPPPKVRPPSRGPYDLTPREVAVPPTGGSPSADPPSAVRPPAPDATAPPLLPPGAPPEPASPPRPAAPDSPRSPPPPPVRPTFVGPEATGTPRVTGGGGTP